MNYKIIMLLFLFITSCSTQKYRAISSTDPKQSQGEFWLTKGDKTQLLQNTPWDFEILSNNKNNLKDLPVIRINPLLKFQKIDGFGFTLTGGSSDLIYNLKNTIQDDLLLELFSKQRAKENNGIGISYLRISLGASDLSSEAFSYDDLKEGEAPDRELSKFSLGPDLKSLVPVLKKIMAINPNIKILASPWSAPSWMKTNKSSIAGKLDPLYYETYAQYFIKYIRAMQSEGILIDAITVQNEPLNPKNEPSMIMEAFEQNEFVKNYLGPAFKKDGLKTKIIIWDHNCDLPEYPLSILSDKETAKFIDGSAFHFYAGEPSCLSKVHDAYPLKNVYLTEQWVGGPSNFDGDLGWHVKNMVVESMRNWSKTILEWNLASDPLYGPHTPMGCLNCLGALTIDADVEGNLKTPLERNIAYYVIAHASKFVEPGSFRVASDDLSETNLSHVAFLSPEGQTTTLIVLNETNSDREFIIEFSNIQRKALLPKRSVGTFTWPNF